jgi:hypothetical protein
MYAKYKAVSNGANCKRCQHAVLNQADKETLDGLYCQSCRQKYDCGSGFDNNSDATSRFTAINGTHFPWSWYPWLC